MSPEKEKQLFDTYSRFVKIALESTSEEELDLVSIVDMMGYGTAKDEIITNVEEAKKLVKNQREQGEGWNIRFETTPIYNRVSPKEDSAIIVEEKKLIMSAADNEEHILELRLTAVLEYIDNQWKVVHWHGSIPQESTSEDTWHINEWQRKNEELQIMVDEKTAELSNKYRELEIEAAVERIRAKALAMHHSEEIQKVAVTMRNELLNLKLEGVVAATIWIKQENGKIRCWDITKVEESAIAHEVNIDIEFYPEKVSSDVYFWKIWNPTDAYWVAESDVKGLYAAEAWLRTLDEKSADEFKPLIDSGELQHMWHATVPLTKGRLTIDTVSEPDRELEFILPKVGSAFDLAYQRFEDLQKAEAQAREAQIEVALERVRAASMAMHKTEELNQLIGTVFTQLKELGFETIQCEIILFNTDTNSCEIWPSNEVENVLPRSYHIHYTKRKFYQFLLDSWKNGRDYNPYKLAGRIKSSYEEWLFTQTVWKDLPKAVQDSMRKIKQVYIHGATMKHGILEVGSQKMLSDEKFEIIKRFASVFEQTYTRFLDLKKAEAQAREAQIEAALERVRAASMAMHRSRDLHQVINVVYNQLAELGLTMHSAQITETLDDKKNMHCWIAANGQVYPEMQLIPITRNAFFIRFYAAIKNAEPFYSQKLSKQQKDNFFKNYFENAKFKNVPKSRQDFIFSCPGIDVSTAIGKDASLSIMRYDGIPFQPTENEILIRFGKVFEQSYTRFLDLQKAEAQAKEAKIEAALEKIRSRSLAMHQSEELHEVITTVFEQLKNLGLKLDSCLIHIYQKDDKVYHWWGAATGQKYSRLVKVPVIDHPFFINFNNARGSGALIFSDLLSKNEKNSFFEYLYFNMEGKEVPKERKKFIKDKAGIARSVAFMHHIAFIMMNYDAIPYSTEENEILLRFASVFEQSYTRFLDLKKAEAQTREAQIEAALERVRATSMAMHKSQDLHKVITSVFNELVSFGLVVNSAQIFEDLHDPIELHYWLAANGEVYPTQIHTKKYKQRFFTRLKAAVQNGESFYSQKFSKPEKDKFYRHFFDNSTNLRATASRKKFIFDAPGFALSNFIGKDVSLCIMRYDAIPYSHFENEILERFGKVFDQSYTRFLDLKKAEAQAREARIEAALERVRAASMAMHKSKELHQVIIAVYNQLESLGLKVHSAQISESLYDKKNLHCWIAANNQVYPEQLIIPITKNAFFTRFQLAQQKGESSYSQKMAKRQKNNFFKNFFEYSGLPNVPKSRKDFIYSSPGLDLSTFITKDFAISIMRYDGISYRIEENEIIKRFGKVFEQSYTRFLDLKKAEAQAREARIEAALERVRAASMAMHDSSELHSVITILANQLHELGIQMDSCQIQQTIEGSRDWYFWLAIAESSETVYTIVKKILVPFLQNPFFTNIEQARKKGITGFRENLSKKQKDQFFGHYFDNSSHKNVPEPRKEYIFTAEGLSRVVAITESSTLQILRYNNNPFLEKDLDLLKRFASVFEQSYTRFLDLKKAEEQAREAQIEAALERVRAASMAMHHTEELSEVISVLFKQFDVLDINPAFAHLTLFDDGEKSFTIRLTDTSGERVMAQQRISLKHVPAWIDAYNAWKDGDENTVGIIYYKPEDLPFVFDLMKDLTKAMPSQSRIKAKNYPEGLWTVQGHCRFGYLGMNIDRQPEEEDKEIVGRFAKEFGRIYQRFLELQKAEIQAREAHIETSLERIRSASMAMHNSEEIRNVVTVSFNQLKELGVNADICMIDIFRKETDDLHLWGAASQQVYEKAFHVPSFNHKYFRSLRQAKNSPNSIFNFSFSKSQTQSWHDYLLNNTEIGKEINRERKKTVLKAENIDGIEAIQKYHGFIIYNFSRHTYSQPERDILLRISQVFEQAYTRFLDLKKAEAQAREAQIVASLERVRAASMAMHHPDELSDVLSILFGQFDVLQIKPSHAVLTLIDKEKNKMNFRMTGRFGHRVIAEQEVDLNVMDDYVDTVEKWKKSKPNSVNINEFPAEVLPDIWELYHELLSSIPEHARPSVDDFPDGLFITEGYCQFGYIGFAHSRRPTSEEEDIVIRFAGEFGTLYQRFLDLKKAEAQAREAEIEASLERVRSKTMAMHNSEDIGDTVSTFFKELTGLGLDPSIRCGIGILSESRDMKLWTASRSNEDSISLHSGYLDMTIHPLLTGVRESWKKKKLSFSYTLKDEDKKAYFKAINKAKKYPVKIDLRKLPSIVHQSSFFFPDGVLYAFTENKLNENILDIFDRFSNVFGQAYIRHRDLVRAESQAREAQIEAALERVRASSLAMHKSHELKDVVDVTFKQLLSLSLPIDGCQIQIIEKDSRDFHIWSATPEMTYPVRLNIPHFDHPIFHNFWKARDRGDSLTSFKLSREETLTFYEHAYNHSELGKTILNKRIKALQTIKFGHSTSWSIKKITGIWIFNFKDHIYTNEENSVLNRFATIFEQAFTRFQDLKKAEAQAREAKIEAALERVRAKAMAMHSSEDLLSTVNLLLVELEGVNVHPVRCGFGRILEEYKVAELFVANKTKDGRQIELVGQPILEGHPVLDGIFQAWKEKKEYFPILKGKLITSYYKKLKQFMNVDMPDKGTVQYGYFYWYENTGLYAWSDTAFDHESIKIYRKFTSVLGLTFNRYQDLRDAEERAKEAQKEASLDRVRAEIASMRTTQDLEKITPLIWKELITLEVPFFRCGVFIVNEEKEIVQAYLTTPQGESLAVLNIPFGNTELVDETVQSWKEQKVITREWDSQQFIEFTQSIIQQGFMEDARQYQGADLPPEYLALHFVPFSQGMLYVGSEKLLVEDQLDLLKSLAGAFSVAYSRYEDFQKLEEANTELEETLSDLKNTQTQLIHAEKMASLGELTAGIAHEIQNPLNFVNNFSEVSSELMEELQEELENGDTDEAKEILQDIIQNLEKIHHHGQRASSIVKGMLDHSRAGSGKKEMTDINILCDEYLRLAYHGLRAKDRSFNASFETSFDASIPKINVVVQDFGRVLLNLINNAFHAVSEKDKSLKGLQALSGVSGYQPKVTVSTKGIEGNIIIEVSDNGPGIPDEIKEKIFQPFFTTKPTGQGTGLGLSLAYDIVQTHGGKITVDSEENRGTKFIVTLKVES